MDRKAWKSRRGRRKSRRGRRKSGRGRRKSGKGRKKSMSRLISMNWAVAYHAAGVAATPSNRLWA
jgi:hypothetical protein